MGDTREQPAYVGRSSLAAALLVFVFALYLALTTNHARDFFIFRLGAELAARGENPYDVPKVRQHIAATYSDESAKEFVENSGYFLPPMAVLVFLPFAMLPWVAAKVAWAVANTLAAYFLARLPLWGATCDRCPFLVWAVVPFVLLLNPLTLAVVFVGQFTLVFVGCVAAGLFAFNRGRPYLAAMLWVVPFVKPHLALPLIPLACYLGGWRPAALLVVFVGVLNVAGAWLAGGSPLFLKEYFDYLPTARDAVAFNRVDSNPAITSWNRLLFACGGPAIELGVVGIVGGYLVWLGAIIGRCTGANVVPSAAWCAAAAAVGAVLCAQVLVYELLFLAVAVPWIRDLFTGGFRLRGWLAAALLALQLVPQKSMAAAGLPMHHSLGVALLAVLVLLGPVSPSGQG